MFKYCIQTTFLLVILLILGLYATAHSQITANRTSDPGQANFIYEDVHLFLRTLELVDQVFLDHE